MIASVPRSIWPLFNPLYKGLSEREEQEPRDAEAWAACLRHRAHLGPGRRVQAAQWRGVKVGQGQGQARSKVRYTGLG